MKNAKRGAVSVPPQEQELKKLIIRKEIVEMRRRKTISFEGMRVRKPYASRFILHLESLHRRIVRDERKLVKFYELAALAAYAVNNGLAPKRWADYWWEVCQSINTRDDFIAWYKELNVF
jgi:hypothetical protein